MNKKIGLLALVTLGVVYAAGDYLIGFNLETMTIEDAEVALTHTLSTDDIINSDVLNKKIKALDLKIAELEDSDISLNFLNLTSGLIYIEDI